jgi:predicted nucleotidyltransferase
VKHHDDAIARYIERVSADPQNLAVILTGSLARGLERPDSDVDVYLVVTEEAWSEAFAASRLMFVETEGANYEHGYFDIKLATLSYLDDAAERGDDPVRESFAHSRIVFSRVDDLTERIERASRVPEAQWDARAASFIAQARLHGGYFLEQATESGDIVLTANAALHLALSASRALLAVNRVLFQGPKYLARSVATLERRPAGFPHLIEDLLAHPNTASGRAVLDALENFTDWGLTEEQTLSTFILDNELAWRYRTQTPEYS